MIAKQEALDCISTQRLSFYYPHIYTEEYQKQKYQRTGGEVEGVDEGSWEGIGDRTGTGFGWERMGEDKGESFLG